MYNLLIFNLIWHSKNLKFMLKNITLTLATFLMLALVNPVSAQNTYPGSGAVGIGTLSPNSSSLLDVTSTSKGVLLPRMTKAQRDAILTPSVGLLIYQTNSAPGFYYYNGSAWTAISAKGANTGLSNLSAGGTAINQALTPAATGAIDLGSKTKRWDETYTQSVDAINNSADIETGSFVNQYLAGDFDPVAVFAQADTLDTFGYGVLASGGFAGAFGVGYFGVAGIGSPVGVYGEAIDTISDWAGYFIGDVGISGGFYDISDRKFKTKIEPLTGSLDKLMQLNPTSYTFNNDAETVSLRLNGKSEMGLVADELEKVFPELIKNSFVPMRKNPITGEQFPEIDYKGVNYVGLIPVLIASIQEQQMEIEAKDAEIQTLTERLERLETAFATADGDIKTIAGSNYSNLASLDQNSPNPFKSSTVISYNIPESFQNAFIKVYSINGAEMKTVSVSGTGKGNVQLDGGSFAPGTYTYQLVIDGKTIDTKLMVITQ